MVAKRCLERGVAERSKADLEEGLGAIARLRAAGAVPADFCAAEERAAEACKGAVFAEVAAVVPPIRRAAGAGACAVPLDRRAVDAAALRSAVAAARSALGGAATAAESARWLAIGDALADAREGILERRGYGTMGAVDALERAIATGGGGDDAAALRAELEALRCAAEDDAAADEIARALAAGAVAGVDALGRVDARALRHDLAHAALVRGRKARVDAACAALEAAARTVADLRGALARAPPDLAGAAAALDVLRATSVDETAAEVAAARDVVAYLALVAALEAALGACGGAGGTAPARPYRVDAATVVDVAAVSDVAERRAPRPADALLEAARTYEAASPGVRAAGVARRRYDACASVARLRASIAAGDFGGARDHLDAATAAAAATRREGVVRKHTRWTAVRVAVKAVSAFRAPIRRTIAAPATRASWLDAAEAELVAWRRVLDDEDRKRGLAAAMAAGAAHLSGAVGDRTADPAPLAAALAALDGGREAPSLATVALATAARPLADARAALSKGDYDALEDAGLHFDAVVVAREAGVHGDGGGDGVVDAAVLGARAEMDALRVEVLNVRAREACEAVAAFPRVVGVPGAVDGSRLDPVAERAALAVAGRRVAAVAGGCSRDVTDAYELAVALGDLRAKAHADDWDAILTKGVLDADSAEVALLRDEASDRRDRAAALAALAEGRPRGAVGSLDVGAVDDAPLRALDGGRRSPATVQLYEIVLAVARFRATLRAGDVDLDEAALRRAAAACDALAESERVKIHADGLRVGPACFDAAVAACAEINHWFGGSRPNFRTL